MNFHLTVFLVGIFLGYAMPGRSDTVTPRNGNDTFLAGAMTHRLLQTTLGNPDVAFDVDMNPVNHRFPQGAKP